MERITKTLIEEKDLKKRVKELAERISKDYEGEEVTLICILSGASIFFADLVRELDLSVERRQSPDRRKERHHRRRYHRQRLHAFLLKKSARTKATEIHSGLHDPR